MRKATAIHQYEGSEIKKVTSSGHGGPFCDRSQFRRAIWDEGRPQAWSDTTSANDGKKYQTTDKEKSSVLL
ncbi:hypothetical protein AAHC03_04608 [Spirometra sp. Aus1]